MPWVADFLSQGNGREIGLLFLVQPALGQFGVSEQTQRFAHGGVLVQRARGGLFLLGDLCGLRVVAGV